MAAQVDIARLWGEDDGLQVSVTVDSSYPDAVAEARASAVAAYKEALGLTMEAESVTDDDR